MLVCVFLSISFFSNVEIDEGEEINTEKIRAVMMPISTTPADCKSSATSNAQEVIHSMMCLIS